MRRRSRFRRRSARRRRSPRRGRSIRPLPAARPGWTERSRRIEALAPMQPPRRQRPGRLQAIGVTSAAQPSGSSGAFFSATKQAPAAVAAAASASRRSLKKADRRGRRRATARRRRRSTSASRGSQRRASQLGQFAELTGPRLSKNLGSGCRHGPPSVCARQISARRPAARPPGSRCSRSNVRVWICPSRPVTAWRERSMAGLTEAHAGLLARRPGPSSVLLVELAQRSDRVPSHDAELLLLGRLHLLAGAAVRASRSWRSALQSLRALACSVAAPSSWPAGFRASASSVWMPSASGCSSALTCEPSTFSARRTDWPTLELADHLALTEKTHRPGIGGAVGERRTAGGGAAPPRVCASGDGGERQERRRRRQREAGSERSWGSSLEPCIGGEAEHLGDVVRLFDDRLGDVKPQRPERRFPEDADAGRSAKAEVVTHGGERQVGQRIDLVGACPAGRACRSRR